MNRSVRKILYIAIAVVIALVYVALDSCSKKDTAYHNKISYRMDSLEYEYQVLLCKKDLIVYRIDTINHTINKVRVITQRIQDVKPVYSTDSLTAIIEQIKQDYDGIPTFELLYSTQEEGY